MLKILSSQCKILPCKNQNLDDYGISAPLLFKNEPFSFQAAYAYDSPCQPVTMDIESELPAECWRVDCVPVSYAANDYEEPGYVTSEAGIVPDLLESRPLRPEIARFDAAFSDALYIEKNVEHTLNATKEMQSVLITVNPDSLPLEPGKYSVRITLRELNNLTQIGFEELELEVLDASLLEQDFCVTNWFHVDCLCDFYGCEPYSEPFYRIFKSFLRNMIKHRQNTLLLPAFTPALDTPIGHARRNVQLVDIERCDGQWHFDFARLARFMKTASDCGIRYFEHCHLFSQWGAAKTPNIYDRSGNRLFGWDTDASGPEYREFIRAYLSAYIDFARREGYTDDRLIFHISDEPTLEMLEGYKKAYDTVADLLAPFNCVDALAELEFYRRGLVKTPVANIRHAEEFAGECSAFWVYYTCGTYVQMCPSRLITITAARTRILGLQMYRCGAKGFLHWGYNYYYDKMSAGWFDPKVNPCGYKLLPGCSYLAYPERKGAVPSLREIHMRECFDDLRTLQLYESIAGKEAADAFLEKCLGEFDVHFIPDGNMLYGFSQAVKREIQKIK